MTSLRHVCQVMVVHIIVENLLSYMPTNFYCTQPNTRRCYDKNARSCFFWNTV